MSKCMNEPAEAPIKAPLGGISGPLWHAVAVDEIYGTLIGPSSVGEGQP